MTIPFEEIKARLLDDLEVQREYDALAPEFEALAESLTKKRAKAKKSDNLGGIVEGDANLAPER